MKMRLKSRPFNIRINTLKIFTLFTLLALASCASQKASVWEVSKDGSTLYIGGTVHVLSESDYPLPAQYDKAFNNAELLVLETDMAALETPEFQREFMARGMYTNGKTIQDVLSPETFANLEQHLRQRNLPIRHFMVMKPGMLSVTLSMLEMKRLGITAEGVDQHYADKAVATNMPQQFLETPQQQLAFIVEMGKDNPSKLIARTLEDTKELTSVMELIVSYWRKGDMQALDKIAIADFKTDYPKVYQRILLDRNNDWIPKIEALLATPEKEIVLVGALHLAGADSVLAKLKAKGYRVEKL